MANYSKVDGVQVKKWGDSEEPLEEYKDATVSEMYFDCSTGNVCMTIQIAEGEILSIKVPVRAREEWNGFVERLPTWTNAE